eukprot:352209-Hanusia_phi.AAC.4
MRLENTDAGRRQACDRCITVLIGPAGMYHVPSRASEASEFPAARKQVGNTVPPRLQAQSLLLCLASDNAGPTGRPPPSRALQPTSQWHQRSDRIGDV